ncbi:MAG: DUF285 domain-containing protein [Clostridia bacterium]|nr:DUF285 domain-containing protein [Clostridia bacterium]
MTLFTQKVVAKKGSKLINGCYFFYNFYSCTEMDLLNLDTLQNPSCQAMFAYCSKLESVNVDNFDTSKVTNMGSMFAYCQKMEKIDLESFSTGNVSEMGEMFYECISLKLLIQNFNTQNVTRMANMFYHCCSLTELDLSNFKIPQPQNVDYLKMFSDCTNLEKLALGYDFSVGTTKYRLLSNDKALTEISFTGNKNNSLCDEISEISGY